MALTQFTYNPASDYVIAWQNARDQNGLLLNEFSALAKLTVTNASNAVLVNAQPMSYTGIPGSFAYTIPAATMPAANTLTVNAAIYDVSGTTVHYTAAIQLVSAW